MQYSFASLCGAGLTFRIDGFRLTFAVITTYMWLMTTLFSQEYLAHAGKKRRYYFFLALTYIATMGVFLSNDFFTTFVFFEVMSLASYVCVIHDEKPATMRAGGVYLAVAVIGGLVTLMGLFLLADAAGTLSFDGLYDACRGLAADPAGRQRLLIAGACILFGFGAKAGMFPLHIWLPMAHPVAPAPASALLSGIITKTGIFGILVVTAQVLSHDPLWGFIVMLLGTVTMLLGGLLALFSVDIKRTLACSSMSQLGMIINGIGMQALLGEENALAVRGSVLHMVNHSNLKLVLFMAAGVIVMNLHKLDLNEIRGYGRKKPLLMAVFLSGALGIGGVPMFNGYVSKTLLHEGIVEYIELLHAGEGWSLPFLSVSGATVLFSVIEWLFLLTGGMTVAYMTKLFICVFVEKNIDPAVQAAYDEKKPYVSRLTAWVLGISAAVLPVLGLFPGLTLDRIADASQGFLRGEPPAHAVHYFSQTNLQGGLISILIGVLLYFLFVRILLMDKEGHYLNRWPAPLDLLTLIYEPLLLRFLPMLFGFFCKILDRLPDLIFRVLPKVAGVCCRVLDFSLDALILVFRKTTHRQLPDPGPSPTGYFFAFYVGGFLNAVARVLNRTILKKHPIVRNHVYSLAEREAMLSQTSRLVSASTAFSLMMFGIGLMAVTLYLIL